MKIFLQEDRGGPPGEEGRGWGDKVFKASLLLERTQDHGAVVCFGNDTCGQCQIFFL